MAVAFSELLEQVITTNTTSYVSNSIAPTADRGLVCFIYTTASNVTGAGALTGGGVTWTFLDANTRGSGTLYCYYALTGASPGSGAVTFTCTADAATSCFFHVTQIDGCDLTDFIGLSDTATETAAAAAPTIALGGTSASTSGILAACCGLANPMALTAPTGYTELMDLGDSAPAAGLEVVVHATPGAVTGATWGNNTSVVSSQIGLEILEAAAVTERARDYANFAGQAAMRSGVM